MALSPGTWLNHYEILGHLGTGGMGEVYRARDNKLQREVALKVLPKAFAQDPERVARFRREAQVLAQLNHTNIATIYSVEESSGTHFLVMELAEGETLKDKIREQGTGNREQKSGIPIDEALEIAKQIAAGLEAAHEKPIVHRDLKPANVKVTPEGVVKILDFGLARAFAGDSASSDPANSPTLTGMTQPGTILGTAAYMSPEQARGKKVDKRTDIWALGCVLYEMLTGKHAFEGEDVPEILASVMKGEPDWTALPATTPRGIRRLLQRCLQKDPAKRFHSAADLAIEMEEAVEEPEAVEAGGTVQQEQQQQQRQAGMPVLLVAVAALALGSIITGLAVWNLKLTPPQPVTRLTLNLPADEKLGWEHGAILAGMTDASLLEPLIALSPDGTRLVYVAGLLYIREMDQLESRPIPGTEAGHAPFFSPDGQWVAFFSDGKLKKVSVGGGAPQTLCDAPEPRGGSWGRDDTIVFVPAENSGVWRVSASGGTPTELTTVNTTMGDVAHYKPEFLPGGNAVLFVVQVRGPQRGPGRRGPGRPGSRSQIDVQLLETGERKTLIPGGTHVHYSPTGHLVYAQADPRGTLFAAPFDAERLEITGPPVPILEGVLQSTFSDLAQFDFSDRGTLAYVSGGAQGGDFTLVWVDRKGNTQPVGAPPGDYHVAALSPDGRQIALEIDRPKNDVWVYDIPRGTMTRLTFEGNNSRPLWMPDGKRIVFRSDRDGTYDLYWKSADGTGEEERLTQMENLTLPTSISRDGRLAFFYTNDPETSRNIWVLPLEGDPSTSSRQDRKPTLFLQTPFDEAGGHISPDGRWIAYTSNDSGRREIYVRPFPGPGGKWQISTEGGFTPLWAPDGRELFYRINEKMMAVEIKTEPSFQAGTPHALFEGAYVDAGGANTNYDISPDGQRFLMIRADEQSQDVTRIQVVLNWFEELKRRVPVK